MDRGLLSTLERTGLLPGLKAVPIFPSRHAQKILPQNASALCMIALDTTTPNASHFVYDYRRRGAHCYTFTDRRHARTSQQMKRSGGEPSQGGTYLLFRPKAPLCLGAPSSLLSPLPALRCHLLTQLVYLCRPHLKLLFLPPGERS